MNPDAFSQMKTYYLSQLAASHITQEQYDKIMTWIESQEIKATNTKEN